MRFSYFSEERPRRLEIIVIALLMVALIGLAFLAQWRITAQDDSDQPPSESTLSQQGFPYDVNNHLVTAQPDERLGRCLEVYAAQQQPLETAAASMSQWEVHIGAMNKLVDGAITLTQATQFWNQTRVGARTRLAEFAAADRRFDQRTARCPMPLASEQVDGQVRRCATAIDARFRVLHSARVGLDTWRMHVRHMEMLRSGEMTPARATELWLQSWRQGQTEVDDYRAAARAARGLSC